MHNIQFILSCCQHQVSACHQARALSIDQALLSGTPFTALGGKRVRCREGLLRFKLGSDWRLLYQITATGVSVRRTHLARLRQAPTDAAAVGRPHSPVASAGVSARP